ncbi:MAG: hypothetical protein ACYCY3_10415 [Halothiobacillus sp.]
MPPPPTQENPATEADRPTADAIVGNPLDYGRQRTGAHGAPRSVQWQ